MERAEHAFPTPRMDNREAQAQYKSWQMEQVDEEPRMDRFVARLNVKRFRELHQAEADPEKRLKLQQMIEAEEKLLADAEERASGRDKSA